VNEEFVRSVYTSIIEGNLTAYKGLFDRDNSENTIEYWKSARSLYSGLDESQKEILFRIIKQVMIDTVSNIFGVIDGVRGLDDNNDWNFMLSINGQGTDDELADCFLEYVEIQEDEGEIA